MAPADIPRMSSPTADGSLPRPRSSRTPGMRATQVAIVRPLRMKMTKTAFRQAFSSRRSRVGAGSAVTSGDSCGFGGSNRFDRNDSTKLSHVNEPSTAPVAARPTLAAVARLAGVSNSTASLAFSGTGPVSDATRERVLAAAKQLNYAGPDPRARSLRRGRSGIVGVVMEERVGDAFRDPIKIALLDGITEEIAAIDAGLLILTDAGQAAQRIEDAPMDAVVLVGCSPRLDESVATLRQRGIPLVAIEGDPADDVPTIGQDNREATRLAAQHLYDLGHRDVAVVTLPLTRDRARGAADARPPRAPRAPPPRSTASPAHATSSPTRAAGSPAARSSRRDASPARALLDDAVAPSDGHHRPERPARRRRHPRRRRARPGGARRRQRGRVRRRPGRRTLALRPDHARAAGRREGPRRRSRRRRHARGRRAASRHLHERLPSRQHHRGAAGRR